MNDELNQVQETPTENGEVINSDNENLFEDYESADESPRESEEPQEETTIDDEIESNHQEPYGLKVKFNGDERVIDEETARTLVQKGMNYERFYEPLERLARLNGMDVGDYIARLNDTQFQYEVSKELQALRNEPRYEGLSDEVLEEIANSHVKESIGLKDKNYEEQQKGIADAKQAKVQRDIDLFMDEYPEFRNKGPEALDPKVFDYVKQGYTLLEAYNKWSRQQVNNPQEIAKQKTSKLNEENKKKSLGNTTNAGSVEADDFLSGFLEG